MPNNLETLTIEDIAKIFGVPSKFLSVDPACGDDKSAHAFLVHTANQFTITVASSDDTGGEWVNSKYYKPSKFKKNILPESQQYEYSDDDDFGWRAGEAVHGKTDCDELYLFYDKCADYVRKYEPDNTKALKHFEDSANELDVDCQEIGRIDFNGNWIIES
ncbi:MAG TPA: hypothetical protein VLA24_12770 [Pseudomonadales bacterium]|nr:hypothetical protein [Pseudomonadales bacterium]